MLKLSLEEIEEKDLRDLESNEIPESIRLEFKQELNLDNKKQKAEAAKDVSAMANTAGGRILYGIDEKDLPDGSVVASSICPLNDGTLDSRLEDILYGTIFPRPRLRTRKVDVSGGYVLIVEVYPAYAADLHMVTGFKENRFYRRGEQRTILMTEPEIREAYARIAASRQALDAEMERVVQAEWALVPHALHSAMVIPLYGHRHLVDPRQSGSSFGRQLSNEALSQTEWRVVVEELRIVSDGYRYPPGKPTSESRLYASIARNGLIHFADSPQPEPQDGRIWVRPEKTFDILTAVLLAARYVLEKAAYWGPVRVVYRLNAQHKFDFFHWREERFIAQALRRKPIDAGTYDHSLPEINLKERGDDLGWVLKELMDQFYQTFGEEFCPWFEPSGALSNNAPREVRDCLQRTLARK